MIVYWIKNKILRKVILKIIGKTHTTIDDEIFPLFDSMVNVIIFGTAIINLLMYFGIDIKGLLTTAGVGSLAIAFAVKDTIIDILSGWMIIIDKPFKVNDNIRLSSGEDVIVLDIGLRKSRFLYNITFQDLANKDCVLIISNSDLIKNKVYNYTEAEKLK
jgi:small-conductance mechanosensitive channel